MPVTSLVSARPEEQARAKSRLLSSAIERIRESGGELDLAAGLQAILAHIVRDRRLNQLDPNTRPKAQAIAIVTTNLGLEFATKGDLDKAVVALTRNPIEKIYAIGEKLSNELQARVGRVLSRATTSITMTGRTIYFGVTDQATEAQLAAWQAKGVSDHPFLPLSTTEEYDTVKVVLDRVERELYFASKVDWSEVFADYGASRFTVELYQRQNRESPNHLGGVWKPFLLSLIVQAMTSGWQRNQRRLAFIDREAMIEFVDLVTFEFSRIGERANAATERLAMVAKDRREGLFKTACKPEEVREIFTQASDWMNELIVQAKRFCFGLDDLEAASDTEVDRFWRTRLFLSSNVPYAVRVAESAELWCQLPQVKSLAALTRVVKDLALWPEAERENFLANTKIDPLLDAVPADKQAPALYLFWLALGEERMVAAYALTTVLRGLIDWTERFDLLLALRDDANYSRFSAAVEAASHRVRWDLKHLRALSDRNAVGDFIGAAYRQLKHGLDEDKRRKVIALASNNSAGAVGQIWSVMTADERERDLLLIPAKDLSCLMAKWKWEAVEAFFQPVLAARSGDQEFKKQFSLWLDGQRYARFIPGDDWFEPFEELCKQYLGRPTGRDLRLKSLPAGHPERKAIDREINSELIAKIASDRPWDRVAAAKNFGELVNTLRNFVLWPEAEQDRICFGRDSGIAEREFTHDYFDALLDAVGEVKAQAQAITNLRRAMREPYKEAGYVNTVLYKLFTWQHRAMLVAELGSGKAIRSISLLNLAREIAWPIEAIERVGSDKMLLEIALSRLVSPENEEEWVRACKESVRCHLGAARDIWERLPANLRPRLVMVFPSAFVAEFLKAESFKVALAIFEPMLTERGADEDFRRQFKHWYEGRGSDTPRFAPPLEWQGNWRELLVQYLGWEANIIRSDWLKLPLGDARRNRMVVLADDGQVWSDPPPWQQIDSAHNLEELGTLLVDLTFWPEAEREGFYSRFRLNVLLDEYGDSEAQAEGLIELWKAMGGRERDNGFVLAMTTCQIDWSNRPELVLRLNVAKPLLSPELILTLADLAWWPGTVIQKIRKPNELLERALRRARPELTAEDWKPLVARIGYYRGNLGRTAWKLMSSEMRRQFLTKFSGSMISELMADWSWEQVRDLLEPLLAEKKSDGNFRNRFADWYFGDGTPFGEQMAFKPSLVWANELQALLAQHGFTGPLQKSKNRKRPK